MSEKTLLTDVAMEEGRRPCALVFFFALLAERRSDEIQTRTRARLEASSRLALWFRACGSRQPCDWRVAGSSFRGFSGVSHACLLSALRFLSRSRPAGLDQHRAAVPTVFNSLVIKCGICSHRDTSSFM